MRVLRLRDVSAKTGLGRSRIYETITEGAFPKPIPLGDRARGWLESEVEAWIRDRVAERDCPA